MIFCGWARCSATWICRRPSGRYSQGGFRPPDSVADTGMFDEDLIDASEKTRQYLGHVPLAEFVGGRLCTLDAGRRDRAAAGCLNAPEAVQNREEESEKVRQGDLSTTIQLRLLLTHEFVDPSANRLGLGVSLGICMNHRPRFGIGALSHDTADVSGEQRK